MPHTYRCPMRFADMDLLGHVNNVTYLDYVAQARADLLAGHPAALAPVRRHQVEFASPLVFRRDPVPVDTWVTEVAADTVTLAHEVYDDPAEPGGERTVYVRVSTVLRHRCSEEERALLASYAAPAHDWRPMADEPRPPRDVFPVDVRRSDLRPGGEAGDDVFFEYFQEARVRYLMSLHTRGQEWTQHVVARTDVDYLGPVTGGGASYAVHAWVGHLGTRSFTIRAELREEDRMLATSAVVMVAFDAATQKPADMAASQRERLEQELR